VPWRVDAQHYPNEDVGVLAVSENGSFASHSSLRSSFKIHEAQPGCAQTIKLSNEKARKKNRRPLFGLTQAIFIKSFTSGEAWKFLDSKLHAKAGERWYSACFVKITNQLIKHAIHH
jgi:hypothetical protein